MNGKSKVSLNGVINIRTLKFSVCLASFNGERYIAQQLDSILDNLSIDDEIVISDDGSTDNTISIIREYQKYYSNIKLVNGPRMGFSCNFANAIENSVNDVIVFSDQDDIWENNKIDEINNVFMTNPNCTTVLHKMSTFRENNLCDTNEIDINHNKGVLRNLIRSSYWGCCMAVRRNFVMKFLPFRDYCVGHDQLIGLMTEYKGKCEFINKKLIKHRLHNSNTSGKRTIKQMIEFRIKIFGDFMYARRLLWSK